MISREQIDAELKRRGVAIPGAAPQSAQSSAPSFSRAEIDAELQRRGVSTGNAPQSPPGGQPSGDTGSFLDYVPGVSQAMSLYDMATQGLPGGQVPPSVAQRQERFGEGTSAAAGMVAGLAGGAAGAAKGGASILGRALGAGAGTAAADAATQAAQEGQVDPRQTLAAGTVGAIAQPAGEALGAAVPAAARALFRGGEKGRQGVQAAIDDAARLGETPTIAQATGGSGAATSERAVASIPGGAGTIRRAAQQANERARSLVERYSTVGGREIDDELAGQTAIRGVEDFNTRFRTRSGQLFDDLTNRVGADRASAVTNTQKVLDDLTKPVKGAEKTSQRFSSGFLRDMQGDLAADAAAGGGQIPFAALQRLRSLVGERLGDPGLSADLTQAQLKKLYGTLSSDIQAAANGAGAGQAFSRANRYFRSGRQRIETTLEPLTKSRAPDRILSSIMSGGRTGGTQIRTLMKSLTSEQQDIVTGSVVRRLGTANPGQQGAEGADFNFGTFLTRWNQLDKNAKAALFNRGRNVQMGQDLEALARHAGRIRETSPAFANPSSAGSGAVGGITGMVGMGSLLAAPVIGSSALMFPVMMAGGAISANAVSRLMTSPRFVRWLAQSTKMKPQGVGAHLGRLATLAAKEDPDTQQAIADYLGMFQE